MEAGRDFFIRFTALIVSQNFVFKQDGGGDPFLRPEQLGIGQKRSDRKAGRNTDQNLQALLSQSNGGLQIHSSMIRNILLSLAVS